MSDVQPVTITDACNSIIYCNITGDDGVSRLYRIVFSDLSTIQVKEDGEWKLRRSTHGDILPELSKFLPAGYTVDDFMAAVEAVKVDIEPELAIVAEGESNVIVRG